MRPKTPHQIATDTREERESKIKSFILASLDKGVAAGADCIAVLARSPESPVARAVLALSGEFAARGMGASIILAGAATAAENETWSLVFSKGFVHEIRLATNPRVLDGHEQLVIGVEAVWYGDSMRRDPLKRDAFESFVGNAPATAKSARSAFARLWNGSQPIYSNDSVASVTVSSVPRHWNEPATEAPPANLAAVVPDMERGGEVGTDPRTAIAETLGAWRPATRH